MVRIRHIKDDWRGFNASSNFLIQTNVEPFLTWISRTSRFPYVVGRYPALELLMLCCATNLENPANLQPSPSLCHIFPYIVVIRVQFLEEKNSSLLKLKQVDITMVSRHNIPIHTCVLQRPMPCRVSAVSGRLRLCGKIVKGRWDE